MNACKPLREDTKGRVDLALKALEGLETIRVKADRWHERLHRTPQYGRPAIWVSQYTRRGISQCVEEADTPANVFAVCIALTATPLSMFVNGRPVHDGLLIPGMVHICPPGSRRTWTFEMPMNLVQVHVDRQLLVGLSTVTEAVHGQEQLRLTCPNFRRDEGLEQVARAVVETDLLNGPGSQAVLNWLGIGLLARLIACHSTYRHDPAKRKTSELPNWRFRRVDRYLTDRLADMVSLAEMAQVSGLSPSYFAAAFRRTVGVRPHDYFLYKKVSRAQEMLARTELAIADVSEALGFASQAHFATVFRRCIGESPAKWRHLLDR